MLEDYGYGYGKHKYAHDEHEEREEYYESEVDYRDYHKHNHHSGRKLGPASPKLGHKIFNEGYYGHQGAHHYLGGGGYHNQDMYYQGGYLGHPGYGQEVYQESEYHSSSDAYYGNGHARMMSAPPLRGYRLLAAETPARKVYLAPGHAHAGRVQEISWNENESSRYNGFNNALNGGMRQGGYQKASWATRGLD